MQLEVLHHGKPDTGAAWCLSTIDRAYEGHGCEVKENANLVPGHYLYAGSAFGPGVDPPIDAISHQIQFIVVWNANATPNWTLVHFKGPGAGLGPFASATDTNTHTLTIVMGVPNSQALATARTALTTSAALGAQLMQLNTVPFRTPLF